MAKIAKNLTELIGHTPLMELAEYSRKYGLKRNIVAKLESFNPAGSVKDRVAFAMIEDAEARGALKPGATIIEPTSGNTGVGLAMVATIKGYHLILTMPETVATDIDLGQNKANEAINRLKNARDLRTNPVLQLNLANAYLQGGQPQEAANILNRYTFNNKDDSNGWDLLAQAEAALNNRDQELAARAEGYALAGRLDQAISLLSSASSQVKLGSLQQARYDARIDQLRQLQERFKPYTKM